MDKAPTAVVDLASELIARTGADVNCYPTEEDHWCVELSTDRARMVTEFHPDKRRRKYIPCSSKLEIDGRERRPASNMEHLALLLKNPDRAFEPDEPMPMPPEMPEHLLPAKLRGLWLQLKSKLGNDPDVRLSIGADPPRWVIGMDMKDASLRAVWRKKNNRYLGPTIQLILDGVDCSADARDLRRAMLAIMSQQSKQDPKPSPDSGTTSGGTGYGSAQQRRSSVIRT